MEQTYMLEWYHNMLSHKQGHMNTITNLLCLGMYLGLLWYITENKHNAYR